MDTLIVGLIFAFIGQTGAIWWRLGKVETAVKKSCPFGTCPFYARAQEEAAEKREIKD